jgi:DNA-binding beta-propeller fold protein YncE
MRGLLLLLAVPLGYGCNDVVASDRYLYVTNSLYNTIQEIDPATNTTVRQLPTTGGINPYSLAVLNHDTLAVTHWVSGNMLLLRLSTGLVVDNIPVGVAPQGIVAHGNRVYVCVTRYLSSGGYGPGVVMVYDRQTLQLLDSIRVGTNPQSASVDGSERLHVACTGDYAGIAGTIHVIDLPSLQTDTVLAVGGTPASISFGGACAFVAAGGWGDHGDVYRYRLSDLQVLNSAANPLQTGTGAMDIDGRSDGTFFVSCFSLDCAEHHSADGQLLQTFPLSHGPGQMTVYSDSASEAVSERQAVPPFSVLEVYPNPFNNAVSLRVGANVIGASTITIYNMLGRVVDRLRVSTGIREIRWTPSGTGTIPLSSGSYVAVWEGGGGRWIARLQMVR